MYKSVKKKSVYLKKQFYSFELAQFEPPSFIKLSDI